MSIEFYEAWKKHTTETETYRSTETQGSEAAPATSEAHATKSDEGFLNLDLDLNNHLDLDLQMDRNFDLNLDLNLDLSLDPHQGVKKQSEVFVEVFNDLDLAKSVTQVSDVAVHIGVEQHPVFEHPAFKTYGGAGGYEPAPYDGGPIETGGAIDDLLG